MKILQINSVCGIGSTGRIATDLHLILRQKDHVSTVAYGRDVAKSCDHTIRIGSRLSNYLHVARTRILDSHGFGSRIATKNFIHEVQKLNPDVIHLHNIHGYYIHIGLLFQFLKATKKPIVWTLHDCWAFTGHCAYFDFIGCDRWREACVQCPLKGEYPKSFFRDRSALNYLQKRSLFTGIKNLTMVTPSNWLAHLLKASFLQEYPVSVIHNGIDLDVFRPSPSDFRTRNRLSDQFVILGVASVWDKRKGIDYFLKLADQLKPDERIFLVGVNAKQIKNLPPQIVGISKTDNIRQLAEIYSAADVFINPTLEDNFPTTNLEALACGTPVVTFNSGGSPESLNKQCGIVVDRGDLRGLLKSIATVKENGKEAYSSHCIQQAKDLFNKIDRFEDYIDLYEKTVYRLKGP